MRGFILPRGRAEHGKKGVRFVEQRVADICRNRDQGPEAAARGPGNSMRLSVVVIVTLIAVLLAGATSSGSCVHVSKASSKPRFIRGDRYKPREISTGRDFGKRDFVAVPVAQPPPPPPPPELQYEMRAEPMLEGSPQRISLAWLLAAMGRQGRKPSSTVAERPRAAASRRIAAAAAGESSEEDSVRPSPRDLARDLARDRSTYYTIADD